MYLSPKSFCRKNPFDISDLKIKKKEDHDLYLESKIQPCLCGLIGIYASFSKSFSRSNLFIIRAGRQQNPLPRMIYIYVYYDFLMFLIPFRSPEHDWYPYRRIARQLLSNFWN